MSFSTAHFAMPMGLIGIDLSRELLLHIYTKATRFLFERIQLLQIEGMSLVVKISEQRLRDGYCFRLTIDIVSTKEDIIFSFRQTQSTI